MGGRRIEVVPIILGGFIYMCVEWPLLCNIFKCVSILFSAGLIVIF
jgi:hypothetical protein